MPNHPKRSYLYVYVWEIIIQHHSRLKILDISNLNYRNRKKILSIRIIQNHSRIIKVIKHISLHFPRYRKLEILSLKIISNHPRNRQVGIMITRTISNHPGIRKVITRIILVHPKYLLFIFFKNYF